MSNKLVVTHAINGTANPILTTLPLYRGSRSTMISFMNRACHREGANYFYVMKVYFPTVLAVADPELRKKELIRLSDHQRHLS